MSEQREIVIYPKLAGLIAAALIFVLLGLGFIVLAFIAESSTTTLLVMGGIGAVSTLFFGAALIFFVYKAVGRKPSLLVNDEGIQDYASYSSGGAIRWEDIEDICFYTYMGQTFIGIMPKDLEQFLNRHRGLKKWLMKINSRMAAKTPINISQNGIPLHLEELFDFMILKWKKNINHSPFGNN